MSDMSSYGYSADRLADGAAVRQGEEEQTAALGQGPAAVAYALLEVAAAIRDHTASQE